jgi:gamma-glutamylcyclotransferase (GGCT)/AIG2-like uncharacterized protein YtfP
MSASPRHLFVYGTLRPESGHPMAAFLGRHARLVGAARSSGRIYDLGPFPGMLPAASAGDWVFGELFELPADADFLARLDEYEACYESDPLFRRAISTAWTDAGDVVAAWVYFYTRPVNEAQRIASGDYLN